MAFFISNQSFLFVSLLSLFQVSEAGVSFTKKPDNPSYVRNGSTAKLVWDYSDPNKELKGIIFSVLVKGTFVGLLVEQNGVIKNHQDIPAAYQGRVKKEGNATLIIENISPRDNTKFNCYLVAGEESAIQLIVAEAPQISLSSVQASYPEGSSLSINCTASGKPEPDVTWVRNGKVKGSGKKAAFLIFNNITRTDDGQYTCRASNSVKITTTLTTLVVHYKPEGIALTTSAVNNTVTQGDTVIFTCDVTAAKPLVSQYTFFLNDTLVKASNDGQYTINNVQRSKDYGEYKCLPRNDVGNGTEATVKLNVNVPVQFTVRPQNITENETNPILMTCDASGFPTPSITWTKSRSGQVLSEKKQLNITSSDKSDTGEYMCTTSNGVGQPRTAKAYVTIQYPPTIQGVTPSTSKSWIGQTVTLKCVSYGVPTPTLTWYKPDGSEINRFKATENTVQVSMKGDHDFGDYKCNAANGLLPSDERIIKIKQITTPGSPSITTSEADIQASSLTVKWTAPADDGGSPITGYRVIILNGTDTEIDNVNITDPGTTSHTFGGLKRDTNYMVKVFARNFVFEGPAAEKTVKTKREGPPAVVEIKDLPAETTKDTITLYWKEPDINGKEITQYTVYRRIVTDGKQGEWKVIKKIMDVSVRELEVKLEKGKVNEFAITATNELGEGLKQDKTKIKRVKALQKDVGGGGSRTGDNNGMNTAIYAGAAAAGVLLIIGIVIIIVLWRRRKPSSPDNEEASVDGLGSANAYEIDDGYQAVSRAEAAQSLQASGAAAEANYAQVDMSKKKKNRRPPTDEYAQVDKSKKTKKQPKKRPGELDYAELGDLRADLQLAPAPAGAAAAVVRPPAYEGTVYADIAQFGVPQPDPTYANVSKGDVVYSNLQSM